MSRWKFNQASKTAGVDVDVDDRQEMQQDVKAQDVKPGESNGTRPSCFNHHIHPLLFFLDDR